MTQRNVATSIILTIVTCGIYGLYWVACVNDELNLLANRQNAPSGVVVILLTIVTCGLYAIYWSYKMGDIADWLKQQRGMASSNLSLLCVIFSVLGLSIVSLAMLQDEINHHATM